MIGNEMHSMGTKSVYVLLYAPGFRALALKDR